MKYFYIILYYLCFSYSSSALEEGILKLNQKIVSPFIMGEIQSEFTAEVLVKDIKSIVNEEECKKVWAVSLDGTYMPSQEFQFLLENFVNLSKLPRLQTLSLATVYFDPKDFDLLINMINCSSFLWLDFCGTLYSNRHVVPFLQRIKEIFPEDWEHLSEKVIFASLPYYKKLSREAKWVQKVLDDKILSREWEEAHRKYYDSKEGPFRKIEKATPLRFLTGDSDEDRESFLTETSR